MVLAANGMACQRGHRMRERYQITLERETAQAMDAAADALNKKTESSVYNRSRVIEAAFKHWVKTEGRKYGLR